MRGLVLVAFAVGLSAQEGWITGVVVEVARGHVDTGATATGSAQSVGDTTTASTTVTATGIDFTNYVIRAGDKLFVIRPDPLMSKGIRAKIADRLGWDFLTRRPTPVTIPANVGDELMIEPFGDRAWVRYGKHQYPCSIVHQTLLSIPEAKQDKPQTETPAQKPPATPREFERPTLRREQ